MVASTLQELKGDGIPVDTQFATCTTRVGAYLCSVEDSFSITREENTSELE